LGLPPCAGVKEKPLSSILSWRKAAFTEKFNKGVKTMAREIITLACTECGRRNYTTKKDRKKTTGRLERSKYCPFDRKHTLHRETRS
jgi:large subunit ribosomal protein L33